LSRTSSSDNDGINAWLEPVDRLVEFLFEKQRLETQPITVNTSTFEAIGIGIGIRHNYNTYIAPLAATAAATALLCHRQSRCTAYRP